MNFETLESASEASDRESGVAAAGINSKVSKFHFFFFFLDFSFFPEIFDFSFRCCPEGEMKIHL